MRNFIFEKDSHVAPERVAVGRAIKTRAEAEAFDGLRLRPGTGRVPALGQEEWSGEAPVRLHGIAERLAADRALGRFGKFRARPFAEESESFQSVGEGGKDARFAAWIGKAFPQRVEVDELLWIHDPRQEELAHVENATLQLRSETGVAQADGRFEVMQLVAARASARRGESGSPLLQRPRTPAVRREPGMEFSSTMRNRRHASSRAAAWLVPAHSGPRR